MARRRSARQASVITALGFALAGCAAAGRVVHQPRIPSCRTVVSADGDGPTTPPEVRWVAPAFAEDRQVLHAWCETIGGVVADTAPARPGSRGTDSLAVVSWNTHVGGGELLRLVDSLRAGALTGGRPPRHFVLLLQEVHRTPPRVLPGKPGIRVPRGQRHAPAEGERVDVVRAARELGLALLYVPSMRNGYTGDPATEEDRGNAILSTLPLSGLTVVELPVQAQRRAAAVAGVTGTTPAGEPWCMRVGSAHLDVLLNGYQARVLVAALAGEPTLVLGGDFNSPFGWLGTLPHLRRAFPQSPEAEYGKTHRNGRLDYLFHRSAGGEAGRVARVGHRFGSDHHPLVGWIPVPRGTTACAAPGDAP